jgi:predicted cobalt transporter CbtA
MLVGVLAGILCFAFLKVAGEPSVDRAIGFEAHLDETKSHAAMGSDHAMAHEADEPVLVSRPVQAGIGLFTGVAVYSAAFGGLFALAFAFVNGRIGTIGPRATSVILATAGFLAIFVVPSLKYPANPPAVGEPETIGLRTALYFAMIAISLVAMIGSAMLRTRLLARYDGWNASLIAIAAYLLVVVAAALALPSVNEVPEEFPAVVLWQFRVASMGAQLIMWATIGVVFGTLTERAASSRGNARLRVAAIR